MYVRDDTVALWRSRGLFLPLACDVHPAVSHRVLYQRRLEKTHSTGNDGTLSYSPQPTPPLRHRRPIGVSVCSCNPSPLESVGSSPWDTRVLFTTTDFEGFFRPGFFWLVTYIREHSAAFDGRSPRIRVTCAFAPMWMDRARAPSCDSDDPARRCVGLLAEAAVISGATIF